MMTRRERRNQRVKDWILDVRAWAHAVHPDGYIALPESKTHRLRPRKRHVNGPVTRTGEGVGI